IQVSTRRGRPVGRNVDSARRRLGFDSQAPRAGLSVCGAANVDGTALESIVTGLGGRWAGTARRRGSRWGFQISARSSKAYPGSMRRGIAGSLLGNGRFRGTYGGAVGRRRCRLLSVNVISPALGSVWIPSGDGVSEDGSPGAAGP